MLWSLQVVKPSYANLFQDLANWVNNLGFDFLKSLENNCFFGGFRNV